MKRKLTVLLTVLMVLALVMGITVACNPTNQPTNKVPAGPEGGTYYCDDGSDTYHISLKDDSKFTFEVAGENREGDYEFAGTALTMKFSETETISAQLRDYNEMTFTYKNKNYTFLRDVDYTVSFDSIGSAVTDRNVKNGRVLEEPNSPTKSGYFFAGWYEDAQYKTRFNFGSKITGNKTLYGKFVEAIAADPEYTVTFVTGAGATTIEPMQTTGGMIDVLSLKPTKSGAEFLGWWVSHENDPNKLTYKYELETLHEDTTFYAVWSDGNPAVSVKDGEATWTGTGEATVEVTNPDGSKTNPTVSGNKATIAFNATGEYQVKVTVGGKTTTAYYTHNRISRVSVFKTDGDLLQFYKVPEADSYEVTLTHKNGTATLSTQDGGTSNVVGVDFHTYDIPAEGYVFTIRATGNNKKESVSQYTLNRVLDKVTGFNVNNDQELSWNAIEGANYSVRITLDGEEVYSEDRQSEASYNISRLDRGKVVVEVTPKMFGWNSPEVTTYNYDKLKLSGVKNIEFGDNDTLTWDAVKDALGYELTINGKPHRTGSPMFQLKEDYLEGADRLEITIRATAATSINDSPESDKIIVVAGAMGDVYYNEGILSWDAVFGVREFGITINDEEEIIVKTKTNSTPIKLVAKTNNITVRIIKEDFKESSAKTTVIADEISFERGFVAEPIPSLFKVKGDPIDLTTELIGNATERFGYDFVGWYGADGRPYEDTEFAGGDMTLTANWQAYSISVKFDLGDYANEKGTEDEFLNYTIDFESENFEMPVPTSSRSDYAFEGWYWNDINFNNSLNKLTDQHGVGVSRFNQFDSSASRTKTLYAKWVQIFDFEKQSDDTWLVKKNRNIGLVTEVTIPETYVDTNGEAKLVTSVSDFTDSINLVKISIPDTIRNINLGDDAAAFKGCYNLSEVEIRYTGNAVTKNYTSIDGVLFANVEEEPKTLVYYPLGKIYHDTYYKVPYGTVTIANGAFYNSGSAPVGYAKTLERVDIAASVELLEQNSFYGIDTLKIINFIPCEAGQVDGTGLVIRPDAFGGESGTRSSAYSVEELTLPKRLTEIDIETLSSFSSLENIHVEEGGSVYVEYDGLLCRKLENGTLELAFFPRGRELPDGKFSVPSTTISSIGEKAFFESFKVKEVEIPAHVTNIARDAFRACTNIEKITFMGDSDSPDLTIGAYAFYGYRKAPATNYANTVLESLTLPENLVSLGEAAFAHMTKLTTVTINSDRDEVNFAKNAFVDPLNNDYASIQVANLGAGVPAFSVTEVFGKNLHEVHVASGNKQFYSDDKGVLYNAAKNQLLFFPTDWSGDYSLLPEVTSIPANFFVNRTGLTGITLHENVTSIGEKAFIGCTSLAKIDFGTGGETLTIGAEAFSNCRALQSVTLPDRLEVLGDRAFQNCTLLTEIEIKANVKYIGLYTDDMGHSDAFYVFDGCKNLTTIKIDPANQHYAIKDGVIYSLRAVREGDTVKNVEDTLLYCLPSTTTDVLEIPSTVRTVSSWAFKNVTGVKKIQFTDLKWTDNADEESLDNAVLKINSYAFDNCYVNEGNSYRGLEEIRFPKGLAEMEVNFIVSCGALKKINVPNTVTTISSSAFASQNYSLSTIEFDESDENSPSLKIEDGARGNSGSSGAPSFRGAFSYLSALKEITFPDRLAYIGAYTFYYASGGTASTNISYITSVKFVESDKYDLEIGNYAFYMTKALTSIELPEGTDKIGANAFAYSAIKDFVLPSSVTVIEDSAFASASMNTFSVKEGSLLSSVGSSAFSLCSNLVSATFDITSETELTLGDSLFATAKNLTSFVVPRNVISLGNNIFASSGLADIEFLSSVTRSADGLSKLQSIGNNAFENTALTSIEFPDTEGPLSLGAAMFTGCKQLNSIALSKTVSEINSLIQGCGTVKKITVDPENAKLEADPDNPIIYTKNENGERSVSLIYEDIKGEIVLGDTATTISASAFANVGNLESIVIPASVQTIGDFAFQNCVSLTKVSFAPGSQLRIIGVGAFQNCFNLKEIDFSNCTVLEKFNGTGTASAYNTDSTKTKAYTFQNCYALGKLVFPASVTQFGNAMFENSGVTSVDMSACTKLKTFNSTNNNNNGIFYKAIKLRDVKLPSSLTFLGTNIFEECTSLREIDLSNLVSLAYFGSSATSATSNGSNSLFKNCTSLKKVTLPEHISIIGGNMFENCSSLDTVKNLDNVINYGSNCFKGSGIESFTLKGGVKYNSSMFQDCAKLRSIKMAPDVNNITELPGSMFRNCVSLKSFDFAQLTGLTKFGGIDVFRGSGLQSVNLKNNTALTSITQKNVFSDCPNLTEIVLPDAMNYIGTYTFQNCTALKKVDLSNLTTLKYLGTSATAGSTSGSAYQFSGCTNLTSVILPASCQYLSGYVFQNCSSLKDIDLSNIVQIGNNCFENTAITSVRLLKKISYGSCVYQNCQKLTSIEFEDGFTGITSTMFKGCTALESVDLSHVGATTLASNMFENCTSLHTVNLDNDKFTSLGSNAFKGCANLKNVTLPETVTHAGQSTFMNCTSLTTIDFSKTKIDRFSSSATGRYSDSSGIFDGCTELKNVILPASGITLIGDNAFRNCTSLETFDLSKVTGIGSMAFQNTAIKKLDLSSLVNLEASSNQYPFAGCGKIEDVQLGGNQNYSLAEYSDDMSALLDSKGNLILLTIDSGTEERTTLDLQGKEVALGAYMFNNVSKYNKIILPDITAIPDFAFYGCGADEIVLPETLETIGKQAFAYSAITKVTIPASVVTIGQGAFAYCEKLTDAVFQNGENEELTISASTSEYDGVGNSGTFEYSGIERVTLPTRLTEISNRMFRHTAAFKSFEIPEHIVRIGIYAFQYSAFDSVVIPANVTFVGESAFEFSASLTNAEIQGNPTLGNAIFSECTSLTKIKLSDELENIPKMFAEKCTLLTEVNMPAALKTMDTRSFGTTGLSKVILPEGFTGFLGIDGKTQNSDTFTNCPNLKLLVIPETCISMQKTFSGCPADIQVYIGHSKFVAISLFGVNWMKDFDENNFHFDYKYGDPIA